MYLCVLVLVHETMYETIIPHLFVCTATPLAREGSSIVSERDERLIKSCRKRNRSAAGVRFIHD